ncbi:hypothetical protein [Shewanella frigidimarina]|uniref:Uncharacterized protein n=1 Tax=Shewanella frigidimarina TaxID=56812 RepID=A0A106C0Z7_SHEFR|nr:hypothetical protein [Shewanella frigidimarina]KVX02253.1 hypothetical protein AWJ07_14835 [Shewanella frigidimarina]
MGTPNKLTFDTRQLLVNALANEFEQLPELLKELKPAERIDAICKLSKFALPTVTAVSIVKIEHIEKPNDDMFALGLK